MDQPKAANVQVTQTAAAPAPQAPPAAAPAPSAPTPSQTVVAAAATTASTKDALGRAIVIRKLKTVERMRLFKILGPTGSENKQLLGYSALAASVVSIDGMAHPFPTSEAQIEALVDRLGDEGLEAIGQAYKAQGWVKDEDGDINSIKN